METRSGPRIVIVGGGIGGVATALGLRRLGIDFVLLEQAPALEEVGAGLQLSPNAVHVLHWLGLAEALAEVAVAPDGLDIRSYKSGDQILWTPLGEAAVREFGVPYYHAHRADLLAVLVGSLGLEKVRLGSRAVGFDLSASAVTVHLESGETVTGDALIGADGIHSMVRAQLFGDGEPQRSSTAWRGLVDAGRIGDLDVGRVSGTWWGPGRSFVHYFVSGGAKLNWVGIVPSDDESVESWSATGRVEDALAAFDGWHPRVRSIILATDRLMRSAVRDREPLETWVESRVALLGDAAHAMLPHHAQGAAQCIEDSHVLSRAIAAAPDDLPAALLRYQAIRRERASWLQEYSRAADRHFQLADPVAQRRRDERLKERQGDFRNGFPPGQLRIYGYNPVAEMEAAPQAEGA